MANSDALDLARTVDPQGYRTVGACVHGWVCACVRASIMCPHIFPLSLWLHLLQPAAPAPLPPPPPPPRPGVLTKLDIMDRGTDAVSALRGEVVPLRLGYVGVVLRSQEDIINRRAMAEARAAERAFFESRPEYAEVALQVTVVCVGVGVAGARGSRRAPALCGGGGRVDVPRSPAPATLALAPPHSAAWGSWLAR